MIDDEVRARTIGGDDDEGVVKSVNDCGCGDVGGDCCVGVCGE